MFKKFRWPAMLALGAAMTFLTPGTAQARDRYDEHEHHHRHHISVYIGHGPGGYYDRWGHWHPYGYGYYDRWGYWHRY